MRNSISVGNTKTKAIVGTNLIYAPTHQFGVQGRVISAKNKTRLAFYTVSGFRYRPPKYQRVVKYYFVQLLTTQLILKIFTTI